MFRRCRRLFGRWLRRGQIFEPAAPSARKPAEGQTGRVPVLRPELVNAFLTAGARRRGSHTSRPRVVED